MRIFFLILFCMCTFPVLASGGGKAAQESTTGPFFLEMDPLILPIVDGGTVVQTVSLVATLDLSSLTDIDFAKEQRPRLNDAFIATLYGTFNDPSLLKNGTLHVEDIKKKLHAAAVEILGKDHVKGVLLQVVQQRPV